MLSLDSPRWSELEHAYGPASDIPALLRQRSSVPTSEGDAEPWFALWSSLAHQGDVYSASFAAVPHVVAALAIAPSRADSSYFQFPAWVEICRVRQQVDLPLDLQASYASALAQLPSLVAQASRRPCEPGLLACMLAAIAAASGQPAVAEAALELTTEVAEEFLAWREAQ